MKLNLYEAFHRLAILCFVPLCCLRTRYLRLQLLYILSILFIIVICQFSFFESNSLVEIVRIVTMFCFIVFKYEEAREINVGEVLKFRSFSNFLLRTFITSTWLQILCRTEFLGLKCIVRIMIKKLQPAQVKPRDMLYQRNKKEMQ